MRAMAPQRNGDASIADTCSAANLLERAHGRFLLRDPPAVSAAGRPYRQLRNQALNLEALLVRDSPGRQHRILRQRDLPRLEKLLQERLRVLPQPLRIETCEQRSVQTRHGRARRSEAAVEEDRAHQRLECVGEDRGSRGPAALQLALPQLQMLAEPKRLGDPMERLLSNEMRPQPGQFSFRQRAEAIEQLCRDHAVEHAIAEELQALVVMRPVTAVREGLGEQSRLGKVIADTLLKALPLHVRSK